MALLPDRSISHSSPQYKGQFYVRPDLNDKTKWAVDIAVLDTNSSLTWSRRNVDLDPKSAAALAGFMAAHEHVEKTIQAPGRQQFRAGEFTNHQFRQFVANDTVRRSFGPEGQMLMSPVEASKLALAFVMSVVSRPLPNALHALHQTGIFKPASKNGFDLVRQTEVQRLIVKAVETGGIPGALAGYQDGTLDDKDYGKHVGQWLARDKPFLVPFLTELSPQITEALTRELHTPHKQNNQTLAQAYIGFPRGSNVTAVERRIQSLQSRVISPELLLGKTFTISTLVEQIPSDSDQAGGSESRVVDAFQMADLVREMQISSAELVCIEDAAPVGLLASPQLAINDYAGASKTVRNLLFIEEVSGSAVTPQALATITKEYGVQLQAAVSQKPSLRMG